MIRLGVWLYDRLAGKYTIGKHRFVPRDESLGSMPGPKPGRTSERVSHYDAQMDDARTCPENILSAQAHGAHVDNYAEVRSF